MTDDSALELGERMFTALSAGDLDGYRSMIAPDVVVWTNFNDLEVDADAALRTVKWLMRTVTDLRYDIVRRDPVPGGFVQRHVLRGTAPDGTELAMPACIWVTITDGLVSRMDEYLDPAGVAALLR